MSKPYKLWYNYCLLYTSLIIFCNLSVIKYTFFIYFYNKYTIDKYFSKCLSLIHIYKTLNGIDKCENGYNLGNWFDTQRQTYKIGKLSKERKKLLAQIGMRFDIKDNDEIWTQMYTLAKNHFEKYGSLERITSRYKTLNGIDTVSYTHLDVYKRQVVVH